jgi:hypothetical protein
MKLQVSQPEGTPHQLDLPGPEVVIGRDPTCDLVLSDERCSRRHAVLTDGAEGLEIRDAGSSNGLWVNGRPLRRSRLAPGDTVRIGDTIIRVLPDPVGALPAAAAGRQAGGHPAAVGSHTAPTEPRRTARATDGSPPLTVTALSVLWALTGLASVVGGLAVAARSSAGPAAAVLALGAGLALGGLGGLMAAGLRARAPWARQLQILAAGLGLLVCPFTFASVTILLYMLREDVQAAFTGTAGGPIRGANDAELTFTLSLLGMIALGLGVSVGLVFAFSGR